MIDSQRRQVLKAVGGVGALFAVGSASATPGRRQGASSEDSIVDIANDNGFTVLAAALEATGLDVVLDSNDDQYTVFAPTDAAFEALLAKLGISAEDLLADPDLSDILLYHVTEGRRYSQSVVRAPRIEMLNGDDVDVDGTDLNGGQATIVATDFEASNGVVHVIDGVLLP
jgi:uncharacterized surface protein with fasciclin (FAS1) repeats